MRAFSDPSAMQPHTLGSVALYGTWYPSPSKTMKSLEMRGFVLVDFVVLDATRPVDIGSTPTEISHDRCSGVSYLEKGIKGFVGLS